MVVSKEKQEENKEEPPIYGGASPAWKLAPKVKPRSRKNCHLLPEFFGPEQGRLISIAGMSTIPKKIGPKTLFSRTRLHNHLLHPKDIDDENASRPPIKTPEPSTCLSPPSFEKCRRDRHSQDMLLLHPESPISGKILMPDLQLQIRHASG